MLYNKGSFEACRKVLTHGWTKLAIWFAYFLKRNAYKNLHKVEAEDKAYNVIKNKDIQTSLLNSLQEKPLFYERFGFVYDKTKKTGNEFTVSELWGKLRDSTKRSLKIKPTDAEMEMTLQTYIESKTDEDGTIQDAKIVNSLLLKWKHEEAIDMHCTLDVDKTPPPTNTGSTYIMMTK